VFDVIVVGGGFAGVAAAREAALQGRSVLLLEARERLGGRTWRSDWDGQEIEYGGQWVHWHQPHTFSEITRAGLAIELGAEADHVCWYVGEERRTATMDERNAIAARGWDRFVEGVEEALPMPHDPLYAIDKLATFDRLTMSERLDQLDISAEERDVLWAELESLAHGSLDDAGAVAVLRWHALSGYSLELTQMTGGHVSLVDGTRGLLNAIAAGAPFEQRLGVAAAGITQRDDRVEVEMHGDGSALIARAVVVAVPLNTLGRISFSPSLSEVKRQGIELGQASRGIKIFIRARGEPAVNNALRPGHPFGHLSTGRLLPDGTQLLIGFGFDASICHEQDLGWVQRSMDAIVPGYEVLEATAHDWLNDEFSNGTWAIHRPGWYEHYHAAMQEPEGRVLLAGSDFANGWAGFIDGAIESGRRAGAWAAARSS
jgi:pseudooxynicotine oxidase